jgi:hypothetical protein
MPDPEIALSDDGEANRIFRQMVAEFGHEQRWNCVAAAASLIVQSIKAGCPTQQVQHIMLELICATMRSQLDQPTRQ